MTTWTIGTRSRWSWRCSGRQILLVLSLSLLVIACAQNGNSGGGSEQEDNSGSDIDVGAAHPRLWVTAGDLPRLRAWAGSDNPIYQQGLKPLAEEAKAAMDAGLVPAEDHGGNTWVEYPSEMYAQLFAFMSLIEADPADRQDYAERARSLLMFVMGEAAKGQAAEEPFRDPEFATSDRSRWWGESFALTTDWIYPYLSSEDKATIREVFLRWASENESAEITTFNHPEPSGVLNDPVLVADPIRVRWAANNYYTAHMRSIGLMAMALDARDDPDGELGSLLGSATGAWLYVIDHLLRNDGSGGLGAEGFEYSPQSLGYVAQFMLALHTAGEADASEWGPQVVLDDNPFWGQAVPAYLHSLSPEPTIFPEIDWRGEVYQPAWYGEGQEYLASDFMELFGPLGLYRMAEGDQDGLEAIRWLQTHVPPGGEGNLLERVEDAEVFRDAILYFMLFDPSAEAPADPRPAMPTAHFAPGIGRLLARTDWSEQASWFTYSLGWTTIDHRHGDGNTFELYRRGEWLTKERSGYGPNISASDYHNTMALENDAPDHNSPSDYRHSLWQRGSQWVYVASGDGRILGMSMADDFVYALGDATDLYNSDYEDSSDILHASRSIVWLKPDHIVVFDRASSRTADRFKRFWLNVPVNPVIDGKLSVATTDKGQQLFITTLLPADAVITGEPAEPLEEDGEPANNEPMSHRLRVEAPGGPLEVNFLHVLQGADSGAAADAVQLVQSESGNAFVGAVLGETVVLFPADLDQPFEQLSYVVPTGTVRHLMTGLAPGAAFAVSSEETADGLRVSVQPGVGWSADDGGVLDLEF
ncbi:MAG: hypothetical protein WD273_01635 [Trueperaceae bacterium]